MSIIANFVGTYVLVRSRNEGVNAGYVVACDETGVVLAEARRLWYHRPANPAMSWYEGVAESGLADGCKLSPPVSRKAIVEAYSLTLCSEVARASIEGYPSHVQQ